MEKAKAQLPLHRSVRPNRSRWAWWPLALLVVPSVFYYQQACGTRNSPLSPEKPSKSSATFDWLHPFGYETSPNGLCPIVEKKDPSEHMYESNTLWEILNLESFRNESLHKLQLAVQEQTQGYDDMINPAKAETLEELYEMDPRWKPFEKFHTYLRKTFPLVHKHLELEIVNKLGLVYTWKGSDASKKPIMLTAHYDVVPVQPETIDQWTFPPFEGGYDGKFVYGRGVSDCKDLLVGLMETVELLLSEEKFEPNRTVILAFGYDEESHGTGAEAISKHLLKKYGPSSMFQLIDEGDSGFEEIEGNKYILPATGEKGHLDSTLEIFTPGGHSSIPPKHTAIGLLAKIISIIEDEQFAPIISNANPVLSQLQCVAEHSKSIDASLKKTIMKAHLDKCANAKLLQHLEKDKLTEYSVKTSQAVDIISGGVKSNALPEHASVLINHRIAVEETVASTITKVLTQVEEFAKKYDLGLIADGKEILPKTENGWFNYAAIEPLEPAPLTPTDGAIWEVFGGSLRYLYEELIPARINETMIFSPYISTGNTDTRFYWDLTRHIYRYQPGLGYGAHSNIHSVDENLEFDSHLLIVAFYYYYLQVVDGMEDPEDL